MRIRPWMFAVALVLAACQKSEKDREPVAEVPTRTDKLVRAAEPVPGSYLVALGDGLGEPDAAALAQRHGGALTLYLPPPANAALVTLDPSKAVVFAEDPAVRFAEEDQVLRVASVEWNLDRIDQRATAGNGLYGHATNGAGINVYVLDTGVLSTHPELLGRASQVVDLVHRSPANRDCNGHGTHVAGVVAGTTVGVAPAATIAALRIADCDGVAEASDLVEALEWVLANHASPAVVLVGATGGPSTVVGAAIDALVEAGVTVVGPAGNGAGDACSTLLGGVPSVVTVGATSAMDVPLASSNRGRCVDLYAPGAAIRSAWSDGTFRLADGTSQAAAHVAGAAALFLEARPEATPAQVADALVGNATVGAVSGVPLGSPDRLLYTAFITAELAADVTAPNIAIVSPTSNSTLSGEVVVSMTSTSTDLVSVAVYVDGNWVGSDAAPGNGLAVTWRTVPYSNGSHVIEARAYDAAGNVGLAEITVAVENAGNAAWDAELEAPVCAAASERCASGSLLAGRGPVGPETHAPNTIHSLCSDGLGGSYRVDESVESIAVQAAIPGHALVEGDLVNVDVTVWGYPDYASDRVDLYFARDAGEPTWEYAGTATIPGPGLQTVSFTYRLPAFPDQPSRPQQAVRATVRYGGAPSVCSDGPYDDHDDLAFAVGAGTPDALAPVVALIPPSGNGVVSGAVNLDATASDAGGGPISRVEFYADEVLVGTAFAATGAVYRVSWLTDSVALGEHDLVAVAYDQSGNYAESDAVTVDVQDLSAPTVAIESPLGGSSVGGNVSLWAAAADNRAVQRVEFRVDQTLVGVALTPPWAVAWDSTTESGLVTVTARAWDGFHETTSAPVTVRIDNQPPTVSIVPPSAVWEVQGEVDVSIQASDDVAVERIDLYAGGTFVETVPGDGRTTPYLVRWNTGRLANGNVVLTARAFDAAGNAAESMGVSVAVHDTISPTVTFAEPAANALLKGVVQVGATATDNGVVTKVEFHDGTSLIGSDEFVPYQVDWNTESLPDGEVTLTATAYDVAGLTGIQERTVRVDNHGPTTEVAAPLSNPVSGTILVNVSATDMYGVGDVYLWADGELLGEVAPVDGKVGVYSFTWATTEFDNRPYVLTAVAIDVVGNVSTSDPVTYNVSNLTTAMYDATLRAPGCASSAAWCYSATLLQGAESSEQNFPNTIGASCSDGEGSVYHQTESIESIRISAAAGSLAPGGAATVTVRYWAPVANEADQLDVYMAANALDPAWQLLEPVPPQTRAPQVIGLNEATFEVILPTGPLQAIRANLRFAQPGPALCSEGTFGDRDDLVFAVGSPSDTTKPLVSLDAPADGAVLGGDFVLVATVSDDQGIAKVQFLVDGAVLSTHTAPDATSSSRYSTVWPARLEAAGAHDVAVAAYDTSGNLTTTQAVSVTVDHLANAAFDAAWGIPVCADVASFCDSADLLNGRGLVGPEPEEPNTLGTCGDGDDGAYHVDESLDWLRVSSVDGLPLKAGKRARVDARVWAYDAWSYDQLSIYTTNTPSDPDWTLVATLTPAGPGEQTLSAEFLLPPGDFQVVRGTFANGSSAAVCKTGGYDDNDDLAFAVEYLPNAVYDAVLKVPACAIGEAWCDSGSLLDGRGALGPEANAPNTLGAGCGDGTVGTYHSALSVDGMMVRTADGTVLTDGQTARLELTVWASGAHAYERVDLFKCSDPSAVLPAWEYLGTVHPFRAGAQVLLADVPVTAGAQAIRAHMLSTVPGESPPAVACGFTADPAVRDDHDDLVFTGAARPQ